MGPCARPSEQSGFFVGALWQAMGVRRMVEASGYVEEGLAATGASRAQGVTGKGERESRGCGRPLQSRIRQSAGEKFGARIVGVGTRPEDLCGLSEVGGVARRDVSGDGGRNISARDPRNGGCAKIGCNEGHAGRRTQNLHDSLCRVSRLRIWITRSITGWKNMVRSMAGKAHLKGNQEALIMDYITAAREVVSK